MAELGVEDLDREKVTKTFLIVKEEGNRIIREEAEYEKALEKYTEAETFLQKNHTHVEKRSFMEYQFQIVGNKMMVFLKQRRFQYLVDYACKPIYILRRAVGVFADEGNLKTKFFYRRGVSYYELKMFLEAFLDFEEALKNAKTEKSKKILHHHSRQSLQSYEKKRKLERDFLVERLKILPLLDDADKKVFTDKLKNAWREKNVEKYIKHRIETGIEKNGTLYGLYEDYQQRPPISVDLYSSLPSKHEEEAAIRMCQYSVLLYYVLEERLDEKGGKWNGKLESMTKEMKYIRDYVFKKVHEIGLSLKLEKSNDLNEQNPMYRAYYRTSRLGMRSSYCVERAWTNISGWVP